MARAIANRLLHEPTLRLKRAAGEDDVYPRARASASSSGSTRLRALEARGEVRELDSRLRPSAGGRSATR